MPRPLRTELIGAWYWVTNRSVTEKILFNAHTYTAFLKIAKQAFDVYGVECHGYVLGKNKYYFLVHTPNGNLSKALRQLNGLYTQFYNKHHQQSGPLFKDRFKSVLIQDDCLKSVMHCLYQMPKLNRWTKDILSYPHSSLKEILAGENHFVKITHSLTLFDKKQDLFLSEIQKPLPEQIKRFFTRKQLWPTFGEKEFIQKFSKTSDFRGKKDIKENPSINTIIQSTSQILNEPLEKIVASKRGRNNQQLGRTVAMYLCRYVGNHTIDDIAKAFQVSHYSAVSVRLARFKKKLNQDTALQQKLLLLRKTVGKFRI